MTPTVIKIKTHFTGNSFIQKNGHHGPGIVVVGGRQSFGQKGGNHNNLLPPATATPYVAESQPKDDMILL